MNRLESSPPALYRVTCPRCRETFTTELRATGSLLEGWTQEELDAAESATCHCGHTFTPDQAHRLEEGDLMKTLKTFTLTLILILIAGLAVAETVTTTTRTRRGNCTTRTVPDRPGEMVTWCLPDTTTTTTRTSSSSWTSSPEPVHPAAQKCRRRAMKKTPPATFTCKVGTFELVTPQLVILRTEEGDLVAENQDGLAWLDVEALAQIALDRQD